MREYETLRFEHGGWAWEPARPNESLPALDDLFILNLSDVLTERLGEPERHFDITFVFYARDSVVMLHEGDRVSFRGLRLRVEKVFFYGSHEGARLDVVMRANCMGKDT